MCEVWRSIKAYIPEPICSILDNALRHKQLEEIRIRANQPMMAVFDGDDAYIGEDGGLYEQPLKGLRIKMELCRRIADSLMRHSPYALENELRQGYIALPGGVRVGVAGRIVMGDGGVRTMTDINSINIRLPRQIIGVGDHILPSLVRGNRLLHTLIISPPLAGKTTLLRDLIRLISYGTTDLHGMRVSLVDERSELAGCFQGVPQFDLGPRVDVLDGCPKVQGMMMALRSLAPQVVATDEIGGQEDANAIMEAARGGSIVLATLHAHNYDDFKNRRGSEELLKAKLFQRFVMLEMRPGPGTLREIRDENGNPLMGVVACRGRQSPMRSSL